MTLTQIFTATFTVDSGFTANTGKQKLTPISKVSTQYTQRDDATVSGYCINSSCDNNVMGVLQ